MPSTPLISFSSGAATVLERTWAFAPGYKATTSTVGGATSGNCDTGKEIYARPPPMRISTLSTAAKMGRFIKMWLNFILFFKFRMGHPYCSIFFHRIEENGQLKRYYS